MRPWIRRNRFSNILTVSPRGLKIITNMGALADFAQLTPQLLTALRQLEGRTGLLNLPPLAAREWYELLERKLAPQLGQASCLIVAVTGGTNIGKSVVFNHLAGFRASASSPLASGTRHPVCLIPPGLADERMLRELFPAFDLRPGTDASHALRESEENWLFWRTSEQMPPNLMLLDTPDIDSDAPVNWERADAIRQSADVLIAVLTQQKYNDAAVKQFFRKAAEEDKPAVILFNQCELPDDEPYWPIWLQTFCQETGISPLYVYVAPNDRKAAEALQLPFYERIWPLRDEPPPTPEPSPASLQDVFARLHFSELKRRALDGALRAIVEEQSGLPAYLREIRSRSTEYQTTADLLLTQRLGEIHDWPSPPTPLVISEVRSWWARQRRGWSATVHGAYNKVGQMVLTPARWVRDWTQGPPPPPWETYQQAEWNAIVRIVGKIYGKLEWLADLGQPALKEKLNLLLSGSARAELLRRLEAAHAQFQGAEVLQETIADELKTFHTDNPRLYQWILRLDEAAAAARPVLTLVLGATGVGLPVGEAATHLASQSLIQGAMHVAGDVVAGTATATMGETAISASASTGAGYLQTKFHQLQSAFVRRRANWLHEQLHVLLLGSILESVQTAAGVTKSAEFLTVAQIAEKWKQGL